MLLRQRTLPLQKIALVMMALSALVAIAVWGYVVIGHSIYFDGYFANGAFQILNPMRRLADGQIPGRDFSVFHGIGTVWLHFPIYYVFGQSLTASEASRFIVSALMHGVACVWLWRILRAHTDDLSALIMALLFFVAAAFALDRIFFPQNSLLGTRSVFPIYVALAMLGNTGWWRLALLAGGALLVSPEHGIAALVGMLGCVGVSLLNSHERKTSVRYAISLTLAVAFYYVVIWLASADAVGPNLEYALRAIPTDQFWYFGVRPNAYLPADWKGLLFWGFYTFAALWIAGLLITILLYRSKSTFAMTSIFLFVYATFGTVSQLGYLSHVNLQGSERALMLICVFGVANLRKAGVTSIFSMCALLGLTLLGYAGRDAIAYAFPDRRPTDGGFLSPYWQQQLSAIDRLSPKEPIWSIYAGLPEAKRHEYAPSFDYIIHALGPKNRDRYVSTFDSVKPRLVRLDNAKTWGYGWWLINSNWDFYRRVFVGYELSYEDKMSTLWTPTTHRQSRKDDATVKKTDALCFVATDTTGLGGVFSLKLAYSLSNPWSKLPIVGQTPRQIVTSQRPNDYGIALPPPNIYGGQWIIPLVLKPNESVQMCAGVQTFLPRVTMKLEGVTIDTVPVTETARQYLIDLWK